MIDFFFLAALGFELGFCLLGRGALIACAVLPALCEGLSGITFFFPSFLQGCVYNTGPCMG
jgi:hypothetical protein